MLTNDLSISARLSPLPLYQMIKTIGKHPKGTSRLTSLLFSTADLDRYRPGPLLIYANRMFARVYIVISIVVIRRSSDVFQNRIIRWSACKPIWRWGWWGIKPHERPLKPWQGWRERWTEWSCAITLIESIIYILSYIRSLHSPSRPFSWSTTFICRRRPMNIKQAHASHTNQCHMWVPVLVDEWKYMEKCILHHSWWQYESVCIYIYMCVIRWSPKRVYILHMELFACTSTMICALK